MDKLQGFPKAACYVSSGAPDVRDRRETAGGVDNVILQEDD